MPQQPLTCRCTRKHTNRSRGNQTTRKTLSTPPSRQCVAPQHPLWCQRGNAAAPHGGATYECGIHGGATYMEGTRSGVEKHRVWGISTPPELAMRGGTPRGALDIYRPPPPLEAWGGAAQQNRRGANATTFPKGVRGTESNSGASRGGSRAEGAVRGVEVAGAPSSPAVGLDVLEDPMG